MEKILDKLLCAGYPNDCDEPQEPGCKMHPVSQNAPKEGGLHPVVPTANQKRFFVSKCEAKDMFEPVL